MRVVQTDKGGVVTDERTWYKLIKVAWEQHIKLTLIFNLLPPFIKVKNLLFVF